MALANTVKFGDGLEVTDEGGGVIRVDATGGGGGVGTQLDYVLRETTLTPSATSAASAEDWIVGNPITLDGSTLVKVEVFCPCVQAGGSLMVHLWGSTGGGTDLGLIAEVDVAGTPLYGVVYLAPSGTVTFKAKVWVAGSGGTLNGPVGTTIYPFLRVTTA